MMGEENVVLYSCFKMFSVSISNKLNVDRENLQKPKLLGVLHSVKSDVGVPESEKFENWYCFCGE